MGKSKKIKIFLPLIFAILGLLTLLGNCYVIKVNDGKIYLHLWDLFNPSYVPIYLTLILFVAYFLAGAIPLLSFAKKNFQEGFAIASAILFLLTLCYIIVFPYLHSLAMSNVIAGYKSCKISYASTISILCAVFGLIFALLSSNKTYGSNVKIMCEDGLLVALAFVLNFIKIPIGSAGSINFQMLPLFIIALRHGPLHGFISGGIVYGLITCFSDGYGIMTYPFDYLLGFGSIAIVGLFRKLIYNEKLIIGEIWLFIACFIATLIRFIGGVTSSIVIYNYNFVAALSYNAIYIPLSGLISLLVLMILLPFIKKINQHFSYQEI